MECHPDARADLEARDRPEKEFLTVNAAELFGASKQGRNDHRGAVKRPQGMKVIQFKPLYESAVEQACCRSGSGSAPADDGLVAGALEARDCFHRGPRPG